jgi:tetratricopeptide (TPR) repeat protein
MPRSDPATSLRVPSDTRAGRSDKGNGDRPRLRLVMARGRLGIELDAPFLLGPVLVEEMGLSLQQDRFPVDLTGGVDAFRHRRGRLESLRLRVQPRELARFAEPRLRSLFPGGVSHQLLAPIEDGWLVGIAGDGGVLAFEVLLAPLDGDLRLLPIAARGTGLGAPPHALAIQALRALVKPLGRLHAGAVVLERAAVEVSRRLLPLAGMRAADAADLRFSDCAATLDGTVLAAALEAAPLAPSARAQSAVELATLVADADDALVRGDLEAARRGYLDALTRAPRHLEIARRLAELDLAVGGRAEAALVTLADAVPPIEAGALGGRLLVLAGEPDAAFAAFRRAAEREAYGPLAAACWLEAAGLSTEAAGEELLDEAIARAPVLTRPRWQRFERRLRAGRTREARADLEHLELQASGPLERHALLQRAAQAMLELRLTQQAVEIYERSLRYLPDSVEAVAGLARALWALGHGRRALELLARAAGLAERARKPAPRVTIDLARALAEIADDRPAAIARVRSIAPFTPGALEARLFEARWRAELGDLAGAGEALARLADAADAALGALTGEGPEVAGLWGAEGHWRTREDARAAVGALLAEGGRIHELDRRDAAASRRLYALAIRLAPRNAKVREAFRRLAVEAPAAPPAEPTGGFPPPRPSPLRGEGDLPPPRGDDRHDTVMAPPPQDEPSVDSLDGEALAEKLFDRLRADPGDRDAASRLADVLERLGRDHELLALLSARLDEGSPPDRPALLVRRRSVLSRLMTAARAAGREDEAELYALMMRRQ